MGCGGAGRGSYASKKNEERTDRCLRDPRFSLVSSAGNTSKAAKLPANLVPSVAPSSSAPKPATTKTANGTKTKTTKATAQPSTASNGLRDDMDALNLGDNNRPPSPPLPEPRLTIDRREIIEEVQKQLKEGKGGINLVVIGHVDAGKSTLMGRLLYELGVMSEKEKTSNERGSAKMGKSSFQYAWALDGTVEERERCVSFSRSKLSDA